MKILIACQCATNKGDRAIAEFLMDFYLEQKEDVYLSTTQPSLWKNYEKKGVKVIAPGYKTLYSKIRIKFFKKALYLFQKFVFDKILFSSLISSKKHHFAKMVSRKFIDIVKKMDLVVVTGGHHITSIREKNALFSVTYDMGLIYLFSQKYVLWSQTIGPLSFSSKKKQDFICKIIENSKMVYIRDENSEGTLKELGVDLSNVKKTYDTVFGFAKYNLSNSKKRKKIGISIFNGLKKALNTFGTLARVLDYLSELGYAIEFFRMEESDEEQASINEIVSMMNKKESVCYFPFLTTTKEHITEMSSCDLFIGYKTHSVILSLTACVPLVAIAYHQKTIDFMNSFGLGEFALMDTDMTYESIVSLIGKIEENREKIINIEKKQSKVISEEIEKALHETII